MNFNNVLSLLRLDLKHIFKQRILWIIIIIGTIGTLLHCIDLYNNPSNDQFTAYYQFVFFFLISSTVLGTITFWEVSKSSDRINYLTLPSSTLEKTTSKFISTMIIFPLLMIFLYIVSFNFMKLFTNSMTDHEFVLQLFGNEPKISLTLLLSGIIISVFSYGSIRYNNASFVKIILRIAVMIAILAAFIFLMALVIIPEFRALVFGITYEQPVMQSTNVNNDHWFISLSKMGLYFIIPLFWTLSYFSLKEKEA